MYDIAVIGGGIIGGLVLREAVRHGLSACLLEKCADVCMGQSKANSGIVHAGFDAVPGTLKAKFNVLGSRMMPRVTEELGVKYVNNGTLVVAFSEEEMDTVRALMARGEKNGVTDMEIIDRETLLRMEPNLSDDAVGALYAKTGAIVCPYELTIAAIGNAMDNGAALYLTFDTEKIEGECGNFALTAKDGRRVEAGTVVNCAGLGTQAVAALIGDHSFTVGARKGEYILLDRESGDFVSHTLFFTPTKKGKGILVSQTVDRNILLGPTAEETDTGATDTSAEGLAAVIAKAGEMCRNVPLYNTITSFAGVRAYSDRHDFIIEESAVKEGFFHCAGIESPGVSAAPAIAEYVIESLVGKRVPLSENPAFSPRRRPDYFFKNLSEAEKNEIIRKDPAYGHIVCRCEQITEGEIRRAIRENPRATDIDAVKRRTRAGMGRCQGGFCQPYVAEILAEELHLPLEKVTKSGAGSEVLVGKSK